MLVVQSPLEILKELEQQKNSQQFVYSRYYKNVQLIMCAMKINKLYMALKEKTVTCSIYEAIERFFSFLLTV